MEDLVVFEDRELRRDPFFEALQRQSCHPYTWLLYQKRRARYYKVERAVRGTYAPDWLQHEAQQRTLGDAAEIKDEWDDFVYDNFMSDMTPSCRNSALQKYIAFEYFHVYGPLRMDAWDRYFYNETTYRNTAYSKE
jgi:hypothetical protein